MQIKDKEEPVYQYFTGGNGAIANLKVDDILNRDFPLIE